MKKIIKYSISSLIRLIFLFFVLATSIQSNVVQWIPDQIHSRVHLIGKNHFQFNVTSNGLIADDIVGNFRFQITVQQPSGLSLIGQTSCFSPNVNAQQLKIWLKNTEFGYVGVSAGNNTFLFDLFQVIATKNFQFNPTENFAETAFDLKFISILNQYYDQTSAPLQHNITAASLSSVGCAPARTTGSWSDSVRWSGGQVPSSSDNVVIPAGSGQVVLSANATIQSLTMNGGELVLVNSSCPYAWSMDDRYANSQKCYRLFDTPMNYQDAQSFCRYSMPNNGVIGSSFDRQLVHIGDRLESDLVYRLCRANQFLNSSSSSSSSSAAGQTGCWIGLMDSSGSGLFSWSDSRAVGKAAQSSIYYDWIKGEPDNSTFSDGQPNPGGERCVAVMPWTDNPLLQEQGGWNDDGCELSKAFVCQIFAAVDRFTLSVTQTAQFSGPNTAIRGGVLHVSGAVNISQLFVQSAQLSFSSSAVISQRLSLQDNAKVDLYGNSEIHPNAFIGEEAKNFQGFNLETLGRSQGVQPVMTFHSSSLAIFGCYSSCSTSLNTLSRPIFLLTRVVAQGRMIVQAHVSVAVSEGGDLSLAKITTMGSDSVFSIGGYASRLSAYDAFILSLSQISPVVNVVWPWPSQTPNPVLGVYKIAVSNDFGLKQTTSCLPYNLSASAMSVALNALSLVSSRGGVTVRQYGNQSDALFAYGFTYHIELDAVSTALLATGGPLTAAIACYGQACGDCYETEVLFPPGFSHYCLDHANFSSSNPNTCVIPPSLSISTLSSLSFCNVTGKGTLDFSSSRHRLPPITSSSFSVSNGIGVVAADAVAWNHLLVSQTGMMVFAGTGWAGWESSYLLYAPSWTLLRGEDQELLEAPKSSISLTTLTVQDNAALLTSGPGSAFTVQTLAWNGGVMGGLGSLTVSSSFSLSGATKYLSYGLQVVVAKTASATWNIGDLFLGNGANLTVYGLWTVTSSSSSPVTISQAPIDASNYSNPFEETTGRSWGSYYARGLSAELEPGWYLNPLCGSFCLTLSQMTFSGQGILQTATASSIFILLPLNMVNDSRINVGDDGSLSLQNGGTLGNAVVVNLSPGAVIYLTGGSLNMEAFCTIAGAGDLLVQAGEHNLAFSINAHITISNGSLIWPSSRGPSQTITFYGGLLINGTGSLQVEPYATTIIIYKQVYLTDQSLIQFPLIGIAEQPTPYDELDAPDTFPRGNLTSIDSFIWEGGELRGNVDINAFTELILDGQQKNISSVAKLINRGHCEWGSGNVIASNNGDFVNYGTVQVRADVSAFSASMFYIGTDVPIANGGDPFALQYHTWDMDYGSLDYSQYVKLRAEFVSQVPNGWNSSDQHVTSIFNNP